MAGIAENFIITRRQALAGIAAAAASMQLGGRAFAAGGEIVIQKSWDTSSIDPHKAIDVGVAEIMPLLADTLVALDEDLATLHPGLAESWSVSGDRLVYSFKLREDVSFANGKKMTAADVEASFNRWLSPEQKAANKGVIGPLIKITATGDYTVDFQLSEPYADFLVQMAQPYACVIDIDVVKALGDQFGVTGFMGTGPYKLVEWKPREHILLERNPDYKWGPSIYENDGPVFVERLKFQVIPDDNARINAMLAGQQAISYVVPPSSIATFRSDSRFEVVEPKAFGWAAFYGLRLERPALSDILVRKAINAAIDRQAIVDGLYYGEADPANFVISPKFADYNPEVEASSEAFDVAKAAAYLDEAGWKVGSDGIREKEGNKLRLVMIGINPWKERAEATQSMLRDVGVDVSVELTDVSTFLSRFLNQSDYDLYCYFGAYTSSGEFFAKYVLGSLNQSPYRAVPEIGTEIDKAILAGRRAGSDEERIASYKLAQKLVAELQIYVPLVHQRDLVVYNKSLVSGVKPHGFAGNGLYKALDLKVPG